jgi:hypothetical protein
MIGRLPPQRVGTGIETDLGRTQLEVPQRRVVDADFEDEHGDQANGDCDDDYKTDRVGAPLFVHHHALKNQQRHSQFEAVKSTSAQ